MQNLFKKTIFLLLWVFLESCKENKNPYLVYVNDKDEEQFIWFNDTTKYVYNFHKNRKLYYYLYVKNTKIEDEGIYFYENGRLKSKHFFCKGKKDGYSYQFYPSGLLFRSEYFKNDTVYGYGVEYFDKLNILKSEFFYDGSGGYIYKRDYDSITQKVVHIHDDRKKFLHLYPNTNPLTLKMPWEDDNWNKK
jgi:antitoxin component YwqK of YwqJK toxin-antitoxin module